MLQDKDVDEKDMIKEAKKGKKQRKRRRNEVRLRRRGSIR